MSTERVNECLSQSELAGLLDEESEDSEHRSHIEHLNHCQFCTEKLQLLSVSDFPQIKASQDDHGLTNWFGQMSPSVEAPVFQQAKPGISDAFVGIKIGNYELLEKAGSGAMGSVYRAHDHKLNRCVAIKIIAAKFADFDLALIGREATATAQAKHPNVVTVHSVESHCIDVDSSRKADEPMAAMTHLLVMEFIDGKTLAQHTQLLSLSVQEIARVIMQVANGIESAHQQAVIHGDIKPANILLDFETGTAKIGDFGVAVNAKRADSYLGGTPGYLAPELESGTPPSFQSDVYSLGMTFRNALSKGLPKPFAATLGRRQAADLNAILDKATHRQPEARYCSMKAFAADIENWTREKSVAARPLSLPEQLAKQSWTHRKLLVIGSGLACLIAATIFSWNQLSGKLENLTNRSESVSEKLATTEDALKRQKNLRLEEKQRRITKIRQDKNSRPLSPKQFREQYLLAAERLSEPAEQTANIPLATRIDTHAREANLSRSNKKELLSITHWREAMRLAESASRAELNSMEPMIVLRLIRVCRYTAELNAKNRQWTDAQNCLARLFALAKKIDWKPSLYQTRLALNQVYADCMSQRVMAKDGRQPIASNSLPSLVEQYDAFSKVDFSDKFVTNKHRIELAWRGSLALLAIGDNKQARQLLKSALDKYPEPPTSPRPDRAKTSAKEWKLATQEFIRLEHNDLALLCNAKLIEILSNETDPKAASLELLEEAEQLQTILQEIAAIINE